LFDLLLLDFLQEGIAILSLREIAELTLLFLWDA